jgi:hypothetical protein
LKEANIDSMNIPHNKQPLLLIVKFVADLGSGSCWGKPTQPTTHAVQVDYTHLSNGQYKNIGVTESQDHNTYKEVCI